MVVGHDVPNRIDWPDRVTFHSIDTAAPSLHTAADFATDNRRFTLDKNRKIVRGMQLLRDARIDYWFTLDADDLIHTDFVKTIAGIQTDAGMLIQGGYLIYQPSQRFRFCDNMVQLCGSTSVLCDDRFDLPLTLDEKDIESVPWCRYPHMKIADYFSNELNSEFVTLDTPLVGYVLGHGDNCSDGYRVGWMETCKSKLKPWIQGRRMPSGLRSQFGIV